MIQNFATIKNVRRFRHRPINSLIIQTLPTKIALKMYQSHPEKNELTTNSSHSVQMMIACAPVTAAYASGATRTARNAFSLSFIAYRKSAITCSRSTFGSYTSSWAPSSSKSLHTVMAGLSRVSPVFFLNANPKIAIRFPDTVLNRLLII